jgi:hypothetical protein
MATEMEEIDPGLAEDVRKVAHEAEKGNWAPSRRASRCASPPRTPAPCMRLESRKRERASGSRRRLAGWSGPPGSLPAPRSRWPSRRSC